MVTGDKPDPSPIRNAAVGQLGEDDFDMWKAVGGVRGLIESVAPGVIFVVVFVATKDLTWAIGTAVAAAAAATIARLIQRTPITQAVSGLAGVLIGAIWAWRSGEAENFYVWGLFVNAAFAIGAVVSIIVRRPVVGLLVQAFIPTTEVPGSKRVFTIASWLWAGAFLARLAVQLPLYLNSHIAWLGTARVLMGLPLWGLVLWLTWLLIRPVVRQAQKADSASGTDLEA